MILGVMLVVGDVVDADDVVAAAADDDIDVGANAAANNNTNDDNGVVGDVDEDTLTLIMLMAS